MATAPLSDPIHESPFHAQLQASGARFTARDGWSIPADFGSVSAEVAVCRRAVGIADISALGKLRVTASPEALAGFAGDGAEPVEIGSAVRTPEGWCCRTAPEEILVLVPPNLTARVHSRLALMTRRRPGSAVADLTHMLAALALVGPKASRLSDRLAGDPAGKGDPSAPFVRSGPVEGVPAVVLREAPDRYMLFFGAESASEMWTTVLQAGEPLSASCVGTDALSLLHAAAHPPSGPLVS